MKARIQVAALLLLACGAAAPSQTPDPPLEARNQMGLQDEISEIFERGCGDDQGVDRCDAGIQRKMRALYGLADAEALAKQGVAVRRAMIVDGYGNDVVAVSFTRSPGNAPMVDIVAPAKGDGTSRLSMSAYVSLKTWERIRSISETFDQRLVREVDGWNGCMHGWFVVAESVDPERLDQHTLPPDTEPAEIRRDAEGACAEGLAMPFAMEMAEIAFESLPECSGLDPGDARNAPALLNLCLQLGGDRMAAAEAYHFLEELRKRFIVASPAEEELSLFFFSTRPSDLSSPEMDSDGRVQSFLKLMDGAEFSFDAPTATDSDHAHATGELIDSPSFLPMLEKGEPRPAKMSDVQINLVRQSDQFVIESFEVSPRKHLP